MSDIVKANVDAATIERVIIQGDLSKLSPAEKTSYYLRVCESLGLNPLTQPFAYLKLSGREVLYAQRNCTDQLRQIHGVSVQITSRENIDDVYVVGARATLPSGRFDESTGAVVLKGLVGEALANALMKAETKAKRRATLSICGLSVIDDTEIETIAGAVRVAPELPKISPFGEVEPGKEYRSPGELAEAMKAIGDAESLTDLKAALHEKAWRTPTDLEMWLPDDAKQISKLYKARERQLQKTGEA